MTATVHYLAKDRDDGMRFLEVGSWLGSSALVWAEALEMFASGPKSLLCVDPWEVYFSDKEVADGEIYRNFNSLLETGLAYDLFRHNIGFAPASVEIDHIRGGFARASAFLRPGFFDLIYLDGNHHYESTRQDIEIAKKLVSEGGVICGDDLELLMGEVDIEHMKASGDVDLAWDPKTGRQYHPGVTRAVGEAFPSVSMHYGFWLVQKKGDVFVPVSLKDCASFVPSHVPHDIKVQINRLVGVSEEAPV
ncbi:MAG: class I SAM-dependent methyltransferase [Alphaproteobacteria bacterium]|nr:class I SAM-dependent methyltransferase [Alphaproteobacteria bacterium]